MKIENKEEIKKIIMKPTVITKCKIGQDWYKNNLEITFVPDEYYPDYMKLESWIMKNLDGKELNIEEVTDLVYDYLKTTYEPFELHVKDYVYGNKVHFDVIVEK